MRSATCGPWGQKNQPRWYRFREIDGQGIVVYNIYVSAGEGVLPVIECDIVTADKTLLTTRRPRLLSTTAAPPSAASGARSRAPTATPASCARSSAPTSPPPPWARRSASSCTPAAPEGRMCPDTNSSVAYARIMCICFSDCCPFRYLRPWPNLLSQIVEMISS